MRLSHSSTNWKMLASYSFWNRANVGSLGLAALAAKYSVLSRSVCDFGQAPRSIFCIGRQRHKQHPLEHGQVPAPNQRNRSATSITGAIKASRFHVIPRVRFRTCRCRRGYTEHEAIIGKINEKSKSIVVMAHDAMETYCVREECMGACPA